ncbi:hypothetical protein BDA96_02G157100 [Sorghum bicolor]|uniref:Uncharacterized protein n=1 Tax=Sorghum bicolor TaxID=4558 RepID=A0A921RMA6_SORBI|nr:hypothetical protein BDA96_02G157100 [Sorghum bicolor]KAG0543059.1 hypothetical protein BDA96_02G157100 [Sorghum bicolor]
MGALLLSFYHGSSSNSLSFPSIKTEGKTCLQFCFATAHLFSLPDSWNSLHGVAENHGDVVCHGDHSGVCVAISLNLQWNPINHHYRCFCT